MTTAILQKRTQRVHEVSNLPNVTQQGNGGLDSCWRAASTPSDHRYHPIRVWIKPHTDHATQIASHHWLCKMLLPLPYFPSQDREGFFSPLIRSRKPKTRQRQLPLFQFLTWLVHVPWLCSSSLFCVVLFCFWVFTVRTGGWLAGHQIRESNFENAQEISDLTILISPLSFRCRKYLPAYLTPKSPWKWARFRPLRGNSRAVVWKMSLVAFRFIFSFS